MFKNVIIAGVKAVGKGAIEGAVGGAVTGATCAIGGMICKGCKNLWGKITKKNVAADAAATGDFDEDFTGDFDTTASTSHEYTNDTGDHAEPAI